MTKIDVAQLQERETKIKSLMCEFGENSKFFQKKQQECRDQEEKLKEEWKEIRDKVNKIWKKRGEN